MRIQPVRLPDCLSIDLCVCLCVRLGSSHNEFLDLTLELLSHACFENGPNQMTVLTSGGVEPVVKLLSHSDLHVKVQVRSERTHACFLLVLYCQYIVFLTVWARKPLYEHHGGIECTDGS